MSIAPGLTPASERRRARRRADEGVDFPATPMLDMAFQLLAFFILTFQSPSRERRIDLYLPAVAVALPGAPEGRATPRPTRVDDLENDLLLRATADDTGGLERLTLFNAEVPDVGELRRRLQQYRRVLGASQPLRIRLHADDDLRYDEAAKLLGACGEAGVTSIRLAGAELPAGAQNAPPGTGGSAP